MNVSNHGSVKVHAGRRSHRLPVAALGFLVAVALGACGGGGGGNAANSAVGQGDGASSDVAVSDELRELFPVDQNSGKGEKFSVGMLLAMTGTGAWYGKVKSQGATLAAEQTKALGGPDFEITIADHKSGDVQAGVSGVQRLIQQNKIEVLLTTYGAVTVAIVPIIQQSKVLSFNGAGPEPSQMNHEWLYLTRMFAGDDQAAGGLAWIAETYPDVKKRAVVGTSENATVSQREIIPSMWPKLGDGRKVVVQDETTPGATDYSQTVARIVAEGAEAVFTFNTGNDHGYLLKNLQDAGFTGPVLGIEYSTDAAVIAGSAYNGYFFTADFFEDDSENPFAAQFVKAYQEKYGEAPEIYAANHYEDMFMIWELIKRANADGKDPHDSSVLRDELEANPTFLSVFGGTANKVGTYSINPDHTTLKSQAVYEVVDGLPVKLAETQKIDLDADPTTALVSVLKEPVPVG